MDATCRLRWTCAPLDALSPRQVYRLLQLRSAVFVVEQDCVFLEPDGQDLLPGAWQLLAQTPEEELAGCLRGLPPGCRFAEPSLGRIVTHPGWRGRGLGRELVRRGLAEVARRHPGRPVRLSAQSHLAAFYRSLGFEPASEEYDEDGIPHLDMVCPPPLSG
ncbi:MAG: ElaA protein [Lysobacteraceae bacterium]|nr:MAG: ElaA protein [Xanthomonadaceae bacterium]